MCRNTDKKFIHGVLTNEENNQHDMEKQHLSFFFNRPGLQDMSYSEERSFEKTSIFKFHQFPDCTEDFSLCIEKATSFILDRESLIHSNNGISYSLHYNDLLSVICH